MRAEHEYSISDAHPKIRPRDGVSPDWDAWSFSQIGLGDLRTGESLYVGRQTFLEVP